MSAPSSTVVSCPGKVLLAGGYLVLEPAYSGLVVGTASRFYTVVQDDDAGGDATGQSRLVAVCSPQFKEATWTYRVAYAGGEAEGDAVALTLTQVQDGAPSNKFVQLALEAALKVAFAKGHRLRNNLDIAIVGDNDFYSQDRATSSSSGLSIEAEPFAFLGTTLADVHKTGLGSSAAMVTSLVAALYLHSCPSEEEAPEALESKDTLHLIHNIAQYAHSQAQGKVGSGFDVSSAIWGSQVYTRFSPECLSSLLESDNVTPSDLLSGLSPSSKLWAPEASTSGSVADFSLPPGTTLLLADVDAGSNTPSMVGKVLKWRKSAGEEGEELWKSVAQANQRLAAVFTELRQASERDPETYRSDMERLSTLPSSAWQAGTQSDSPAALFVQASKAISTIRSRMKEMGEQADVPIEPDEQTRLLNACTAKVPGVIGGGVPGAGGYDAIWVLVLSSSDDSSRTAPAEEGVRQLWLDWTEMSVRPLSRKARIAGPAPTAAAQKRTSGLQVQDLKDVPGLEAAVRRRQ